MDVHLTRRLAPLLLAALLLVPPSAAQVFAEAADAHVRIVAGETEAVAIHLSNPTDREYFFLGVAGGDLPGDVALEPREGSVPVRSVRAVNLTVTPDERARPGTYAVVATLAVVDRQAGTTFEREVAIDVTVERPPRFLQVVDAPFPPPFDAGWGLLLLEAGVWLVFALAASWVVGRVVHRWAKRAPAATRVRMAQGMRRPLALLIVASGLYAAWRLVDGTPAVTALQRLNQVVVLVAAGLLAYRGVQAGLAYAASRRAHRGDKAGHEALFPILQKAAAVVVAAMVALQGLRILGLDVSVLLAGGVVVGLVLSLAAQDTLSNLFSGMFILADQPFREGDEIRLSTGEVCRVDRIGLRSTRLFHFRHEQQMIVPNNALATERVTNLSYPDPTHRLLVRIEVAYDADLQQATALLRDAALATPGVLQGPGREPVVYLRRFQDSGVLVEVRVYVPSSRHRNPVRTALMLAMKQTLDAHGIEIPVPQRDVRLLRTEAAESRTSATDP